MEPEANLPAEPAAAHPPTNKNLVRSAISNLDTTTSSSSSSFSSSSSPEFFRNVQAAFKRHRPLGIMQGDGIKPRRMLGPQRQAVRNVASNMIPSTAKSDDVASRSQTAMNTNVQVKNPDVTVFHKDASVTPPPVSETMTKQSHQNFESLAAQREQPKCAVRSEQFGVTKTSATQGADVQVPNTLENLSSHLNSLALTEMEWEVGSQAEVSNVIHDDAKHPNFQSLESDAGGKSDAAVALLGNRATVVRDQSHELRSFLNQPATRFSAAGTTCATTTSVHSSSAPLINATTYSSQTLMDRGSHVATEAMGDSNMSAAQGHLQQSSNCLAKGTSKVLSDNTAISIQASSNAIDAKVMEHQRLQDTPKATKESGIPDNPLQVDKKVNNEGQLAHSVANVQLDKTVKQEKVTSGKGTTSSQRKRTYDPDLFFKVNGKLYQRLGKIGSGGSSEVHKVISSDCTIYALKKIKLRGRDYATAYGFCQEIEYLNRLKGKNNIIQLIDYEVTDKNLLREVINGSISNKDGKVKDDACIYMVLEYGEIDLAHMLSQKWKEMDGSNQTLDDNWLRFYWQQILLAVNTIHEERIVHSDLKPANFLLVKGSLKLIDFGIAKAIMSDTTNIQRDSQVGTLSYMSPEAFMCNEQDANGNVIKCGRPSDIWSLGCILYQMVYGRTPFADYKTFWAKFKVITDPNHEITYEPVSNPWLLDLMKKCLAWERNERWRIPQLLQHPFLVPPVASPSHQQHQQGHKLLQLVAEACSTDENATSFCSELQRLLSDPVSSELLTSRDRQREVISRMSLLCSKIEECVMKLE
ncbi:Serine/threonine-protein kinase MPS1 [Linum grandiflorum]